MNDLEPTDVGPAVGGDRSVSETDRQHVITLLTSAHAEGRLDAAERDRRLTEARAATVFDDLVPLTRDLVTSSPSIPLAASSGEQPQIAAVFGGVERRGYWKVPAKLSVSAVFGGVELDVTQAAFEATEIALEVHCVFGGIELTVPEGTEITNLTNAVFGGCTIKVGPPQPGGIHIVLSGGVGFGGVEVRNPRASRVRREQRRQLREARKEPRYRPGSD
jgi:DUF1707 SHOCT-like domain/Cell wall-active antibiotics response LiaF, C-terminal